MKNSEEMLHVEIVLFLNLERMYELLIGDGALRRDGKSRGR